MSFADMIECTTDELLQFHAARVARPLSFDERHDARYLCACGRHLVTWPAPGRLPLGCAFGRQTPGRWGVLWTQPDAGGEE